MTLRPTETELKFRVEEDMLASLRHHPALQGKEHISHLRSVYFDTPAGDLNLKSLTLRVRDTGAGYIQTVKQRQGTGGFARGEWELNVPTQALDFTALGKTPAGKAMKGKLCSLKPVFSTAVERRVRSCSYGASLIEVAFDCGEISAGKHTAPVIELELELKEGDVGALFALGRELVRDSSIRLSFESKGDRGYRLLSRTQFEPRLSVNRDVSSDASATTLFQEISRGCIAQVVANAELFRAIQGPEPVHQMRVGIRRLSAALAAFDPILHDGEVATIQGELKWFTTELETARDLAVFIEGVFCPATEIADGGDLQDLGRQLLKAQASAYKRAMAAVYSRRYALMIFDTATWIETCADVRSGSSVRCLGDVPGGVFASDALDRLYKRTCKRGRKFARLDSRERHKLRIRAKELSYATEFFGSMFKGRSKVYRKFLLRLKRVQYDLGALNDIAVSRDRLLMEADIRQPKIAFAAGQITGRNERYEPALLRAAAADFKRFRSNPRFWRDRD